ncbi:hypothetical protein LTR64_003510 [Lithohypha guttulata]|uniref:uncharacterized protein n=1 Tax=Lithohypha guttulata TaxID=1690604 RepID=UPI002DE1A93E|nr:hypothetical protein LTR51_000271 [Lithohypha guttulata]
MRSSTFLRRRRVLLALVAILTIYLFIKYLPTDVPSVGRRIDSRTGRSQGQPSFLGSTLDTTSQGEVLAQGQLYDGLVKYYHIARTLRPHQLGKHNGKENVIFLLHDLRTAASLVGCACDVALYNRTNVHLALLPLNDDAVEQIMDVSGISQRDCPIFVHDARPDYNLRSSRRRRIVAIQSAINHLHSVLKPAAFLVDQQQIDHELFGLTIKEKVASIWTPLITVPNHAPPSTSWLSSLDGTGLSLLNNLEINIIITPFRNSAGSLIRLLNSLQSADYAGLSLPRITVEIPQNVDTFALHYLENFRWPNHQGENKLILRRQINPAKSDPASASIHTTESFYPPSTPMSHVLVLSPDVEPSPNYLHYLTYLTLQYKYSRHEQDIPPLLMGISLDLPHTSLNGKDPFIHHAESPPESIFLSQSPSATAVLYFGDKWIELQNYLSLRLKHDPSLSKTVHDSAHVSDAHPAFLRPVSELMQAQNYFMLYPGFATSPDTQLVAVHTEMHQTPEEYYTQLDNKEPHNDEEGIITIPTLSENTILTEAQDDELPTSPTPGNKRAYLDHEQSTGSTIPITSLLGLKDHELLPPHADLPIFTIQGRRTELVEAGKVSSAFVDRVSLELSGCKTLGERDPSKLGTVEYFFCY